MKYIVLSGISPYVLRELEHNKVKTIEIRSPHNFLSAIETEAGDVIFLTSTSQEDVRPGTAGVIAKIREKQVSMHRMIQKTEEFYEEAEVQMARLQLEMKGTARVRRSECCELGEATVVDADEVLFFEGR
ncbi:MAG: DUF473 domain-containing protein [Candidatus Methanoperedens sp.]|nr:DUF473 domain-containing protein [Candidatus Methanoperedens sp.]MCZ7370555.1 DUF473 domain-containing protein [Candidatus Methanoperedens sp.]